MNTSITRLGALPLLLSFVATACTVDPPEACEPADAPWVDADQDGYPVLEDCDDNNDAIHPLAFDDCNGIDDDCNGTIDDGWPDVDGDGAADCEVDELCNGLDDDGDGLIDEGYADFDDDGIADCLDDACSVDVDPAGGTVPIDEECLQPDVEVVDPWNVAIEWQWKDGASNTGSILLPVVGRLIDTDGDGDVDTDDVPVIVVKNWDGTLAVVRGDTGTTEWVMRSMSPNGGVLIADVDGDGETEIATKDSSQRVVVINAAGSIEWTAPVTDPTYWTELTTADLDGDGTPEVISPTRAYDGATGAVVTDFGTPSGVPYYVPTVGDIDLDGEQEVLIGRNVYSPDGTIEWSHDVAGSYGHWAALVNLDGDPEGEVVVVGSSQIGIYEHDGTRIALVSQSDAARPGPICVADFDGDGTVEMGWASSTAFAVYELDGTQIWRQTVSDPSGLAGCAGYDVNGDGVFEVVFSDQNTFYIFDGATGTVRYSQGGHNSGTVFEYPVIADVDADGSAEIVLVSNNHASTWGSITVFGHDGDGWMEAGATWPVHDFAVTNVLPDGSVPASPDPSWQVHNIYRARPAVDTASSNLSIEIVDVCVSGCDDGVGTVGIAVDVWNNGASPIDVTIPVTLFRDDGGVLTPIETQTLPGLTGGTRAASLSFVLPIEELGSSGFLVRVDDDGTETSLVTECDESDNEDDWPYPTVCE